ncbi:MAG: tail fiber domain-containing protein [bacterium]
MSSAGWIGATGTNQVYLDNSNGYVGIGTGIPSQKLEVNGNIKLSSAGWIGATGSQIYMDNAGGYYVGIGTGTPSQKLEVNGNIKLTSKGWIGATGNQLYLTTGGYVGINDPLPSEALSINGNIFSNGNMILKNAAYIGYTGYTSQLYFYNNGKIGIGTNTPTNTEALTLSGNIKLTSGGRIGYTGNQIYMGPNGYVGIGTGTPQYKLDINGGAAADSWYLHSDKRLKKDITPMNDALDKILSLNGYYFTRKNTGVKSF